jgi:hypothetical protein
MDSSTMTSPHQSAKVIAIGFHIRRGSHAAQPQTLFAKDFHRPGGFEEFFRSMCDISKDDQHFMMIASNAMESSSTTINVVVNWLEELKQRVPVK